MRLYQSIHSIADFSLRLDILLKNFICGVLSELIWVKIYVGGGGELVPTVMVRACDLMC